MSALTDAISTALIHALWQDSIAAILLWAALAALPHRSANARYAASCTALGLMVLFPILTAGELYLRALPPDVVSRATTRTARALVENRQAMVGVWMGTSLRQTAWISQLQQWTLALWSVGVLLFSLRPACGSVHAIVLKRRSVPADGAMCAIIARLGKRLGVRRPVRVAISSLSHGPATLGWLRPVILLPPATALGFTPQQLEAVLAHELAHIRRHDYVVNVFQMVAETLFFYHPAVWWASKCIRVERELCCDDLAVGSCGDALCYAQALTRLARLSVTVPSMAVGSAGGPLVHRIQRVLGATSRTYEPSPWPAVLAACLIVAFGALDSNWIRTQAQALTPAVAGGKPAFDVASVKRNMDPDGPHLFQALPGGRVNLINQTVRELIYSAYQTQDYRIIGGPGWLQSDRFDIVAKAERDAPPPQMLLMVRTLLADRFKLTMRRETRELPIYRLVMARGDGKPGPQLRPSTCDPGAANSPDSRGATPCVNRGGGGSIVSTGATMDTLANRLGRLPPIGRPVVNQTGLTGRFDLELNFTPDQSGSVPAADAISIFTALPEQLGLKLESTKGPVDVLVIDHVEKPTED
ncbi:MAG TPA: M56 and DUF3738 domain-containing protein [Chloroflexota bacterium]|nr:M56 and DUF3738 domain-containing protein [Chloroflexota bacterium]